MRYFNRISIVGLITLKAVEIPASTAPENNEMGEFARWWRIKISVNWTCLIQRRFNRTCGSVTVWTLNLRRATIPDKCFLHLILLIMQFIEERLRFHLVGDKTGEQKIDLHWRRASGDPDIIEVFEWALFTQSGKQWPRNQSKSFSGVRGGPSFFVTL